MKLVNCDHDISLGRNLGFRLLRNDIIVLCVKEREPGLSFLLTIANARAGMEVSIPRIALRHPRKI